MRAKGKVHGAIAVRRQAVHGEVAAELAAQSNFEVRVEQVPDFLFQMSAGQAVLGYGAYEHAAES